MKVSQISFDIVLADGITSEYLIKILEKIASGFGTVLGSGVKGMAL